MKFQIQMVFAAGVLFCLFHLPKYIFIGRTYDLINRMILSFASKRQ